MVRYSCFDRIVLVVVAACIFQVSFGQTFTKAASNAFVIERMVEKFHIQPRNLDDSLSADFFSQFLKRLDEERIYFNHEDLQQLAVYRFQLDEEVRQKQTGFLTLAQTLYVKRLGQADTMIDAIAKKPFNFSLAEKFSINEDTSYPNGLEAMHSKLYKKIKLEVLYDLIDFNERLSQKDQSKYNQQFDSARAALQKKQYQHIKETSFAPSNLREALKHLLPKHIARHLLPVMTRILNSFL